MKNPEEEANEILESRNYKQFYELTLIEIENAQKKWEKLQHDLLEWQGACIRANLAIKSIKFKHKDGKNINNYWKTYWFKELKKIRSKKWDLV